jgi:hypothetical protein
MREASWQENTPCDCQVTGSSRQKARKQCNYFIREKAILITGPGSLKNMQKSSFLRHFSIVILV